MELCLSIFANVSDHSALFAVSNYTNTFCCPPSGDSVLNWTAHPVNATATMNCPSMVFGTQYNDKENATRFCKPNGKWDITNYDPCILQLIDTSALPLWFCGYTLSTITVVVALVILRYFRSLRCLRNHIHCNLFASYILLSVTWYMTSLPIIISTEIPDVIHILTGIINLFAKTANYFWMFVEGLYLFTVIFWTYGVDRFKVWHYGIVGWGMPFFLCSIAILWSYAAVPFKPMDFPHGQMRFYAIYIPILISVIINAVIMAFVIYTLFKKLKQNKLTTGRQTRKPFIFSTEYRKAIKAAVVLIPLFGIAMILFMVPNLPLTWMYINAIAASTQGFSVALIYCFLNLEVRRVIKAKYRSWTGLLPSSSRGRFTNDDSFMGGRHSNSLLKHNNDNNEKYIFQCRSHRMDRNGVKNNSPRRSSFGNVSKQGSFDAN